MEDQLTEAVERAAEFGAPPKVWHVGPDAAVEFADGRHPFDGMIVTTHWSHDG